MNTGSIVNGEGIAQVYIFDKTEVEMYFCWETKGSGDTDCTTGSWR